MLILTRSIGQTIMIGDDIEVTILGYGCGQIRVGIEADKSIPVHRLEIWEKIQKENKGNK